MATLEDIIAIEAALKCLVTIYKDKTLNGLPQFADINPSFEHFAPLLCERLLLQI